MVLVVIVVMMAVVVMIIVVMMAVVVMIVVVMSVCECVIGNKWACCKKHGYCYESQTTNDCCFCF